MASTASTQALQDNAVFTEAYQKFLDDLGPEHISIVGSCDTSEGLLRSLHDLPALKKHRIQARRYAGPVMALCDRLEPFFSAIGLIAQGASPYAAIAWGGIKLVLQLASGYPSFFEKLTKNFERLAQELPQYERVAKLYNISHSSGLRFSLGLVYRDLLSFLHKLKRIFVKDSGCTKRAPLVVGALMWKPFDSYFADILENLRYHRNLVEVEIQIAQYDATQDHIQLSELQDRRAAEHRKLSERVHEQVAVDGKVLSVLEETTNRAVKDAKLREIRDWLAAYDFTQSLDDATALHEDDTCTWICDNEVYEQWQSTTDLQELPNDQDDGLEFGPAMLWVHGAPGTGKTVLAATVIEDLRCVPLSSYNSPNIVLYYFFKYTNAVNGPATAYRALLAQILHYYRNDVSFVDKFVFTMDKMSHGQTIASSKELLELLKLCMGGLTSPVVVIDGVDECSDPDSLIQDLMRLGFGRSHRLLLLSRLNVSSLLVSTPERQQIEMQNSWVSADIALFLSRKLETMKRTRLLASDVVLGDLTAHLERGAGCMFIWARLMFLYLRSPALTPSQRLRTIKNINSPEGLDEMYFRILKLIAQGPDVQRCLAMKIFTWLAFSNRQLSAKELQQALSTERETEEDGEPDEFADFRHTVVVTCGGLVQPSRTVSLYQSNSEIFQFVHLSVKEWVISLLENHAEVPTSLQKYLTVPRQANIQIAQVCLRYMTHHVPAQPLSGLMGSGIDISTLITSFPFAAYASTSWIDHLTCGSKMSPDSAEDYAKIISLLRVFLSQPATLMAWIETFFVSKEEEDWDQRFFSKVKELLAWSEAVQEHGEVRRDPGWMLTAQRCRDFAKDLKSLAESMGILLCREPYLIWDDATAFVPSRFWLKSSAINMEILQPTKLRTRPSSEEFESFWNLIGDSIRLEELYRRCPNWTARYELWSIAGEKPSKALETTIDLDQTEVWLAIYQSLRKESQGIWRIHFPVAIREDLQSFIILRTLFTALSTQKSSDYTLKSTRISFDFNSTLEKAWSEKLKQAPPASRSTREGRLMSQSLYYTYRMSFSLEGSLIYFSDYQQWNNATAAVLEVTDGGSNVVLVGEVAMKPEWEDDKIAFHPTHPTIFIYHDRIVYSWAYRTREPLKPYFNPNCGYKNGLQEMAISDCGKFLIMTFPDTAPVIQGLPHLHGELATSQLNRHRKPSRELVAEQSIFKGLAKLQPGQSLKTLETRLSDDGYPTELYIRRSSMSVEVQKGGCTKDSIRLTTLPNWSTIQSSKIAVQWPTEKRNMINIILNQVSRKHYSQETQASVAGPVIIQRDQRAILSPSGSDQEKPQLALR